MKCKPLLPCTILLLGAAAAVAQDPAPEVAVCLPVSRMVADYETVTGHLEAAARVELRARATGFVEKVAFKEGAEVRRGDVLFELDSRTSAAQHRAALAQVALSQAGLQLAKANVDRTKALAKARVVSQEEVDKAQAEATQATASLEVARANADVARLQLDFTKVAAPIDGVLGLQRITVGDLVKADETPLGTIVSREPLRFTFTISEATVLRLRKFHLETKADAKDSPLRLGVATERGFPREGTINFLDCQVDPATGAVRVRGVLVKADGLLPGMSFRGKLVVSPPQPALLIPTKAVGYRKIDGNDEAFVLRLKDNVLVRQDIQLGATHDNMVVVKEGLKQDDRVAVDVARRSPGMVMQPRLVQPGE